MEDKRILYEIIDCKAKKLYFSVGETPDDAYTKLKLETDYIINKICNVEDIFGLKNEG